MNKNRALGAVSTPKPVIDFMLELLDPPKSKNLNILEPACADAPFLNACRNKFGSKHSFTGVEFNADHSETPIPEFVNHIQSDYLLWNPKQKFDLIIGNPPYGIIGHKSHYPIHGFSKKKPVYKELFETWHGKYNMYGAFIEKSVKLLNQQGQLLFIVPASWMLLDDFKKLRVFLSETGTLNVHYLGRAFPNAQVAAVVLHFLNVNPNHLLLFDKNKLWRKTSDYQGEMISFENDWTSSFQLSQANKLEDYFEIFFAARSPEIKSFDYAFSEPANDRTPLLTGRNLKSGYIEYGTNHTQYWIQSNKVQELRWFYSEPHLVIGHTKGARIVAAWENKCYAWREEFHLVPKTAFNINSLINYLNSSELERYTKTLYKDMIPHITKSQLKRIPIQL